MKNYRIFHLSILFLIGCLDGCGGGDMPPSPDTYPTTTVTSTPTVKRLSATTDSAIDLQDAISVLKMIVGLDINPNGAPITAYQAYAADYDGNGKVELADAIGILKQIVGLTSTGPQWVLIDPLDSTLSTRVGLNPGANPNLPTESTQNIIAVLRGDVTGSSVRTVSYAVGMTLIAATSGGETGNNVVVIQ